MHFLAAGETGDLENFQELATIVHPLSNKEYVLYTDYNTDSSGRTKVYASEVVEEAGGQELRLEAVQTEEEWEYLEQVLQLIMEVIELEDDED